MHYIGERQHRQRGGGGKGRGAASEKSISVAGATAVAATDSVASRHPKEWLAGWLAGWRTGLLHARHASFVPQADCAFSSIGLTHRSTEGRIGAALCYRWTNYLPAGRARPRETLPRSFIALGRPCIKMACERGEGRATAGAGVLLILVSGSLWVLNQIDWRAGGTD